MITYDTMQPGDIPIAARMSQALIEKGLGWSWRGPRIARNLARGDTLGVVARNAQGACVGFMLVRHDHGQAHVLLCAVAPEARRQGVGRALFEWFEPMWSMIGLKQVVLELRQTNQGALAFYQSLGFEARALIPGYYKGREDAVRMIKRLDVFGLNDRFDVFEWLDGQDE